VDAAKATACEGELKRWLSPRLYLQNAVTEEVDSAGSSGGTFPVSPLFDHCAGMGVKIEPAWPKKDRTAARREHYQKWPEDGPPA
jgi:hypothetical protein